MNQRKCLLVVFASSLEKYMSLSNHQPLLNFHFLSFTFVEEGCKSAGVENYSSFRFQTVEGSVLLIVCEMCLRRQMEEYSTLLNITFSMPVGLEGGSEEFVTRSLMEDDSCRQLGFTVVTMAWAFLKPLLQHNPLFHSVSTSWLKMLLPCTW